MIAYGWLLGLGFLGLTFAIIFLGTIPDIDGTESEYQTRYKLKEKSFNQGAAVGLVLASFFVIVFALCSFLPSTIPK